MTARTLPSLWEVVARQHGAIARWQLVAAGLSDAAIKHRLAEGRLFVVYRGVYAVGRRELSQEGQWMAAVLACGEDAALSHWSAAELLRMGAPRSGPIHVSGPRARSVGRAGIVFHRRTPLPMTTREGIPVTTPIQTLFDVAVDATSTELDRLINEAAKLGLVTPKQLHAAATAANGRAGAATIRQHLERQTLLLTDSELERHFLRIVKRAGLPEPITQARVAGFRVDFFWPEHELVVETDGATFHRTPSQQTSDRKRDQRLTLAGFVVIRFTHAQVVHDTAGVRATLKALMPR